MRRVLLALLALFYCSAVSSAQYPAPTKASIKSGESWIEMYVAASAGMKTSGAAKMAFSYGIASMKMFATYRGPVATIISHDVRPTFKLENATSINPTNIVIVRLQKKKDHREVQLSKANAYTGASFEFPAADVTSVEVRAEGNDRIVTPVKDLEPGEYLLVANAYTAAPSTYGGFDFSIQK